MSNFENMQMPVVEDKSAEKPAEEKKIVRGQYEHVFTDGTVNHYDTPEQLRDAIDAENENSK